MIFETSLLFGALCLDLRALQKQFIERGEVASRTLVILQSDSTIHGHANIRLATNDQSAHPLLYKAEQESVLSYLVAYQCEFPLRSIPADVTAS